MKRFLRSLKFELSLAKSTLLNVPGFSATVIATLSVTLGALICIFSLNHVLMVKSLPYPNAENLLVVQHAYADGEGNSFSGYQSAPGMLLWYKNHKIFEKLSLVFDNKQLVADHPEQPNALINFVMPDYFSLLKPEMHLGRVLNATEGLDTHKTVVVLSYQTWQKWFQSDVNIIGNKTMIGHISYKVIGVTAESFIAAANLRSLKDVIVGDSTEVALLLLSGVIGLLLIAITNVTNLFLSRAAQKQRTMAIQAALGAKPNHLFIAMFAESLILTVIAGILGLLVAGWGFVLLSELAATQLPRISELGVDNATLLFTGSIVILLAAIFAKLSSRVVKYDKPQAQLQSSGKGRGLQVSKRTRHVLIAVQVALATLLLAGASIVIDQAFETVLHPLGFNEEDVYYLRVDRPKGLSYSPESLVGMNLLTLNIKSELEKLPQVVNVSRSIKPFIYKGSNSMGLTDRDEKRVGSYAFNMVDHDYFDILELPLVQGRTFTEQKDPR